jgi:hypothetical protein
MDSLDRHRDFDEFGPLLMVLVPSHSARKVDVVTAGRHANLSYRHIDSELILGMQKERGRYDAIS